MVRLDSFIPKAAIFCFEKYWIRCPGFLSLVADVWNIHWYGNSAKVLSAKFKLLPQAPKKWSVNVSQLDVLIENCNMIILMLDTFEE